MGDKNNKNVQETDTMRIMKIILVATTFFISTSANAALLSRLGGLAYYDTEAELTWLADANYARTTGFSLANPTYGVMRYENALEWLDIMSVEGVGGWRLPNTVDVGNDGADNAFDYEGTDSGYNINVHSELSNMFFNILGNSSFFDTNGEYSSCTNGGTQFCETNTGPFINVEATFMSIAAIYDSPNSVWAFDFAHGRQFIDGKDDAFRVWAVHDGDVANVVPVPAAAWLFVSGLIGLLSFAKRKK